MADRKIQIEDMITVGALAEKLEVPVSKLITELMKNGVMATLNERIDFDTAQIIVAELGLDVELTKLEAAEEPIKRKTEHKQGESRPPVVAVMGHVDHGKTSLLDAIRGSKVASGEAGGITQYISAYQVVHNQRAITFLDTPGHAAFAALREHGAALTDLVIIMVAADDGVKPQTVEAIRYAKAAGVKMIVAINKIDKPGADVNRVKQDLAQHEVMVEGWGGEVTAIEVSAKTKQGINELLDMVLLTADVEELKAPTNVMAHGLIIESHMEQGKGPIAIGLVDEGTLKVGDYLVAGTTYAKVKTLSSTDGVAITSAGPATPVVITGFKALPEFGNEFVEVENEKLARSQAAEKERNRQQQGTSLSMSSSELIRMINRKKEMAELNVVVKADVQGSLKSVIDSMKALGTDEVGVRIVGSGIGAVNENDVHMAATSGAIIYGFNVIFPPAIKQIALRDQVSVRLYKIIYELLDDVKNEMTDLLKPTVSETELGRLVVKGIFKLTKTEVICGGEVTKGKISLPAKARVVRDGKTLAEVEITNLKRGPQDVKEVPTGEMAGVSFKSESRVDLAEGDWLEFFNREEITRTL